MLIQRRQERLHDDGFKANVDGGEEIFNALTEAVAEAETELDAIRANELN